MTVNRNLLSEAVRFGLAAGAVGLIGTVAAPAYAQQGEQATELDRIEVTGSRIKRAEIEGPSPITVIDRADIDVSGELSVADFLRNNVYNSFGSTRESSGSATGSQATINLRGIGSVYTLVLLDGRRMTSSPTLSGGAQNINLIPMAAVERIEILREGAGAIYGSDAIGGVVNVILRKDYEGLVMSAGIERPTAPVRTPPAAPSPVASAPTAATSPSRSTTSRATRCTTATSATRSTRPCGLRA